jgi:hypothetical protein
VATMVPAATVAKMPAPNAGKQVASKVRASMPDQRLAVGASN